MESFQRYFLIFAIVIMGYLLLLRWDPPSTLIADKNVLKDEVSTNSPVNEEFGFIDNNTKNASSFDSKNISSEKCEDYQIYKIKADKWDLEIDLLSGSILKVELPLYPVSKEDSQGKSLFYSCGKNEYSQSSGFVLSNKTSLDNSSFKVKSVEKNNNKNVYVLEKKFDNFLLTKVISFNNSDYFITIEERLENLGLENIDASGFSKLERNSLKPLDNNSSFFGDPSNFAYLGPVFSTEEDTYKKVYFDDLEEQPFRENSQGGWVALLEHYFLTAIIPKENELSVFLGKKNNTNEKFSLGIVGRSTTLKPGDFTKFGYKLYFGPKVQSELKRAKDNLVLAVDYGFLYWIGQPMFLAMDMFYKLVGNWGWAIVLVTLLIKVLLWPLSYVSYKSMGRMRQIQPQLKEIQERNSGDRQAMSQAMMDLYKKEKVNPALGCLPMLLQMPFFLAFYWVLIETVELRYAPFLFWITDLSSRDPFFILPILNIGAMWMMQLLQPQPAGIDPMQAKIFKFMPLIFGVLFAFFPAGLVLYWLINSIVSAVQMLLHSPRSARN